MFVRFSARIGTILSQVCLVGVFCLVAAAPERATAEGLGGYLEYNFSKSNGEQRDSSGTSTTTNSTTLQQRYSLAMDKMIYPNLRFSAGGYLERTESDFDNSGQSTNSTLSKFNPYADLNLSNQVISSGLGFSRREETISTEGGASATTIVENYNAKFGWKPEGLPSLDLLMSRLNSYDANHVSQDIVSDTINLNSRYKPVQELDLSYQGSLNTLNDNLTGLEVQSLTNSMRFAYGNQFFSDRVALATSYNISTRVNDVTPGGSGEVRTYLRPNRGYSTTIEDLVYNPDRYTVVTTANVNPNLLDKGAQVTLATKSGFRTNSNVVMVLESAFNVSINEIRVFVTVDNSDNDIPAIFSSRFGWKVYASDDGLTWTEVGPVTSTFNSLRNTIGNEIRHGFDLTFPTIANKRYIQVVTVAQEITDANYGGISPANISVYNVEPYFVEFLQPGQTKTTHTLSGLYDLNLKVKLLEEPSLFYDMTFTLDHSSNDTMSSERYLVLNGLSMNHRFNSKLAGSARLAREDSIDPERTRSSNTLSLALSATPLPTLNHSLVYSGRVEEDNGASKVQNSLFLTNTAELYRGVNVNLSAGGSMGRDEVGVDQKSLLITAGASLQPHRALSVNLSFSDSRQWLTGGGKPDQYIYTQLGDISSTFNPLRSVYLFGGFSFIAQNDKKTEYTRNLGGSWSPFKDGALLLNLSYRESVATASEETNRAFVSSLRWNIQSGSYLDVSYLITRDSSISQTNDARTFSTSLRLSY